MFNKFKQQVRRSSQSPKAPKKLVAGRFHATKADAAIKEEKPQVVRKATTPKRTYTLDDLKKQLSAWAENERIPGKFQAWFTANPQSQNSDWRLVKDKVGAHEVLNLDPPATSMEIPEVVTRVREQIQKGHLRILKKSLRQICFRAAGNGDFALLIQANLRGRNTAHESKTFVDFIQHACPEIISCHFIQCYPDLPFNPSQMQQVRIESKCIFGSDFLPIGNSGFAMHVLDWAPRIKDAWVKLPERIKDAIHPNPEDKLFEFYSASSFIGASLSSFFSKVVCLDYRDASMQSTHYNMRRLPQDNLHFLRKKLDAEVIAKFFSKKENDGRWTFYFNPPFGEPLPTGVIQTAAASRPERILYQSGDLETAAKEIKRFRREGYILRKNIPLYLEPDSSKFEVLFIFVPDRNGLLGQNPAIKARSLTVQRPKERPNTPKRGDIPHFVQTK
ncbi:MAG: hypothetical protein HUK21_05315 [Fibrobacteraceae bacterium]|nr:hypothetical protein [Fibrobacteraceae bacterium]